jgi:hypothetical protein
MSKMKNWMMDIQAFCDGYFHGDGENDFEISEIVEDVGMYFKSNDAKNYAQAYLNTTQGPTEKENGGSKT